MSNIDCLIPAAGRSTRMGNWKLMLPLAGKTVIEKVVSTALTVCARVVLVTGHRSSELHELFAGADRIIPVENLHWRTGMLSSIRCGAAAVESELFFIALADMPFLNPEVYSNLIEVARAQTAYNDRVDDAYVPVFNRRRGHPVLLRSGTIRKIQKSDAETSAMHEIMHRIKTHELAWRDDTIHRDLDTPGDYSKISHDGASE